MGSEICYDNTNFFTHGVLTNNKSSQKKAFDDFPEFVEYGKATFDEKPRREDIVIEVPKPNLHNISYGNQNAGVKMGYCIRKGESIKYNPNYPYSDVAYNIWKQWANEDYIENFCHLCGKPYPTTKRRPLCDDCFYN